MGLADRIQELYGVKKKDDDSSGNQKDVHADVRTLWVDWDEQGVRYKHFRAVCQESYVEPFPDAEVEGPPTMHHLLKHMLRVGGDPRLWFKEFAKDKRLHKSDRVWHELENLSEVLFLATTHDQLNLPALAAFERLARRISSVMDAYSVDDQNPNWKMS